MLWGLPSGKINVMLRPMSTWFLVGVQAHCFEDTCCDVRPCHYSEVGWKSLCELGGVMKAGVSLVTFFDTAFRSSCVTCLVLLERCLPKREESIMWAVFQKS